MPTRRQCAKCPWKKSTNPYDIPGGYDLSKHKNLKATCLSGIESLHVLTGHGVVRQMACHESAPGDEFYCVGWLAHQLGRGNNLAVRLMVARGQISADYELVGEQHECFEDTLPRAPSGDDS